MRKTTPRLQPYRVMAEDPSARWRWLELTFLATSEKDARGVAETKLGSVGLGHWRIKWIGLCAPYAVAS